jgi:hypothetical protein
MPGADRVPTGDARVRGAGADGGDPRGLHGRGGLAAARRRAGANGEDGGGACWVVGVGRSGPYFAPVGSVYWCLVRVQPIGR